MSAVSPPGSPQGVRSGPLGHPGELLAIDLNAGEIRWQGQPIIVQNPNHARRLGIGMVFQHFSLFEALTVSENIALGLTAVAIDRRALLVSALAYVLYALN